VPDWVARTTLRPLEIAARREKASICSVSCVRTNQASFDTTRWKSTSERLTGPVKASSKALSKQTATPKR
jgi:hypothetical protein